jgi:uncharacterized protein YpmS
MPSDIATPKKSTWSKWIWGFLIPIAILFFLFMFLLRVIRHVIARRKNNPSDELRDENTGGQDGEGSVDQDEDHNEEVVLLDED